VFSAGQLILASVSSRTSRAQSRAATSHTVRQVLYFAKRSSHSFEVVLPRRYSAQIDCQLLVSVPSQGKENVLSLYHFKKQVSYFLETSLLASVSEIVGSSAYSLISLHSGAIEAAMMNIGRIKVQKGKIQRAFEDS
jgi:hypothetical protein